MHKLSHFIYSLDSSYTHNHQLDKKCADQVISMTLLPYLSNGLPFAVSSSCHMFCLWESWDLLCDHLASCICTQRLFLGVLSHQQQQQKMWKAASCSIEHSRCKMHHALKLPFVTDNPVCQLDTLEKMRAQARNSLPQVGLWACLWQHFINC